MMSTRLILNESKSYTVLRISLIAVVMIAGMFTSCLKDKYDFEAVAGLEWSPELAVPLVHSTLTMEDILNEVNPGDIIITDSITHALKVIYKGQFYSKTAEELFPQMDQYFDSLVQFNLNMGPPPDSAQITVPITLSFTTPNSETLDSFWYESGDLMFSLESNMNHQGKVRLQIPGLRKNSMPYDVSLPYNYTGAVPVAVDDTEPLAGYTCVFNSSSPGYHSILAYMTLTVYSDLNPNNSPYYVNISIDQAYVKMAGLFGNLNQQSINVPIDTVKLGIFTSSLGGQFMVDNPKIKLFFRNSFGIPASVNATTLAGHSSINPPYVVPLTGTGLPHPFFINAPTMTQIGQDITTMLELNQSNSNISSVFNLLPSDIHYAMDVLLNPNTPIASNFVLKDSKLVIDVDVEVPLSGSASGFTLQDTIDFSLDTIDNVESMKFKFNLLNGFPINAYMQVYLADSNHVVLDSLLQPMQRVIAAGITGPAPDYKVTTPTRKITEVTLDKSRLEKIFRTKYLILKAEVETANGGTTTVKIYSDYFIDVKIGTRTQLKVTDL